MSKAWLLPILGLALTVLFSLAACAPERPALVRGVHTPDAGSVDIRCGAMIDGISATPTRNTYVHIERGRIRSIDQEHNYAGDAPLLDLSDYTCLPGLVDMHTHLMDYVSETADLSVYFRQTLEDSVAKGRVNAEITLMAGFTAARNLGTYHGWTSKTLRDEIDCGAAIGPRLQVAGVYLTIPGGGGDLVIPGVPEGDIPEFVRHGVARGPEEFADKARAAVDAGADVLKIIASGAVLAYGGVPGAPEMTPEEIAAVVGVAHAAGIKVTAHAHGAQSIKDAILAGVDSIEHASLIDAEGIALAAEHDVALSMDVYGGDYIAVEGRKQGWPEEFLRKNDETTLTQREGFAAAHRAGVPIVFGTDAAIYPHGDNAKQFAYMVEWGMSPIEAIRAATSAAARYMGWGDRIGVIKPGYYGDLIAVKGDPLTEIAVLETVAVVVKGGHIFKSPPELVD